MLLLSIALTYLAIAPAVPAYAQAYQNPHGNFSGSTQHCMTCHTLHEAPGAKLVKSPVESSLCLTCHDGTGSIYNVEPQMNMDPASNAMHPIRVNLPGNPGTYDYTPNTTAGLAPPGPYDCSQCHNPHGEAGYGRLLRAAYDTSEYVAYSGSPDPYEACWTCHNRTAIVNDTTFFPLHNYHIVNLQSPCTACHFSPHGNANAELVTFNLGFVTPSVSTSSGPAFVDYGPNHGSCTLTCHGKDHGPVNY